MSVRLGVYGGTFDPIHLGHLIIAEQAREQLELDQVLFIPSGNPPHKSDRLVASPRRRLEMVQLAIAGNPRFTWSDFEVRREEISYTVETLKHLRESRPDAELFVILGADNLAELSKWRQPGDIADLARLCFAGRPGSDLDFTALEGVLTARQIEDARRHRLSVPLVDISSSDIRERIAQGRSIRYLAPAPVEAYIASQNLYR